MDGNRHRIFRLSWRSGVILGLLALSIVALAVALGHASPELSGYRLWLAILAMQVPLIGWCILTGWRFAGLAAPPATFAGGFLASATAQLVALIAPARLWEVVKPTVLSLHDKVSLGRGAAAVAMERVLDVAMLGAMTSFALATTSTKFSDELRAGIAMLAILTAVGAAGVACIIFLPRLAQYIVDRLPFPWLRSFFVDVLDAVRLVATPRAGMRALLASALVWLMAYLAYQAVFLVIADGRLDWHEVLVVFVISTIGLAASVAPAGLGTFEGAVVASLVSFGYSLPDATAIAIALRLALTVSIFPPLFLSMAFSGVGPAAIMASLSGWGRSS